MSTMTNANRPAATEDQIKQAREILKVYYPGKHNSELAQLLEETELEEFIHSIDPDWLLCIHVFRAALVSMFHKKHNNHTPIK